MVLQIKSSESLQKERLQAFVDGAVLAVEQVDEVRISVAEKNIQAKASDGFMSSVLEVLLAGLGGGVGALVVEGIASRVAADMAKTFVEQTLSKVTRQIIEPIVGTHRIFLDLPTQKNSSTLSQLVNQIKGRGKSGSAAVASPNLIRQGEVSALRRYASVLAQSNLSARTLQQVATDIWKSVQSNYQEPKLELDENDMTGTGILGGVQKYASTHRMVISISHAAMEGVIRLGLLNVQDSRFLVYSFVPSGLKADLNSVRNNYKLLFESIIWSKIYGFDTNSPPRLMVDKKPPRFWQYGAEVAPELGKYWAGRFHWAIPSHPMYGDEHARLAGDLLYIQKYFQIIGKYFPSPPEFFRTIQTQST